jgi:hypothetical protein
LRVRFAKIWQIKAKISANGLRRILRSASKHQATCLVSAQERISRVIRCCSCSFSAG